MTEDLRPASSRDDIETQAADLGLNIPYADPARRPADRPRGQREVPFSVGICRTRLKSRGAGRPAVPMNRG